MLMIQPHGRAEGESETRDRLTNPFFERLHKIDCHRFSAKEGAQRREQARPRTNIQVHLYPFGPDKFLTLKINQGLDGKFGEGKSEAHGKYSAKEGVRPSQARPQTNIQVG